MWERQRSKVNIKEGVPELCGNASGARLILKREFQNYVGTLVELGKYKRGSSRTMWECQWSKVNIKEGVSELCMGTLVKQDTY